MGSPLKEGSLLNEVLQRTLIELHKHPYEVIYKVALLFVSATHDIDKLQLASTLNSAYNEVTFNENSAITKENLRTKYTYSPINTSPLTKSHL